MDSDHLVGKEAHHLTRVTDLEVNTAIGRERWDRLGLNLPIDDPQHSMGLTFPPESGGPAEKSLDFVGICGTDGPSLVASDSPRSGSDQSLRGERVPWNPVFAGLETISSRSNPREARPRGMEGSFLANLQDDLSQC